MYTVFLGGTCNGSTWRDELMPMVDQEKISAFNPVVETWDEEAQKNEDYHKENDDLTLYVLTPEMKGVYGIFELAFDSCKRPGRVVACILHERDGKTFDPFIEKNMVKIEKDLLSIGVPVFENLQQLAEYLNNLENKMVM